MNFFTKSETFIEEVQSRIVASTKKSHIKNLKWLGKVITGWSIGTGLAVYSAITANPGDNKDFLYIFSACGIILDGLWIALFISQLKTHLKIKTFHDEHHYSLSTLEDYILTPKEVQTLFSQQLLPEQLNYLQKIIFKKERLVYNHLEKLNQILSIEEKKEQDIKEHYQRLERIDNYQQENKTQLAKFIQEYGLNINHAPNLVAVENHLVSQVEKMREQELGHAPHYFQKIL